MKLGTVLLLAASLALVGCESKTTTIGDGEAGTYKKSINRAGDAASSATSRVEQDNALIEGKN